MLFKQIIKEMQKQRQELISEIDEILNAYEDRIDKMDYTALTKEFERIKAERIECCLLRSHLRIKTRLKKTEAPKIAQLDKETREIVGLYPSVKDAADELCVTPQHIHACLKGKIKTAYGYIWENYGKKSIHKGKGNEQGS